MTSFGWIECVGNADRSCYDLEAHGRATKERLTFEKKLPEPKKVKSQKVIPDKKFVGKTFRSDVKAVIRIIIS